MKTADQAVQPTGGLPAARMDQNVEPEEAGFRDRRGITLRGRDAESKNWSATIYGPQCELDRRRGWFSYYAALIGCPEAGEVSP